MRISKVTTKTGDKGKTYLGEGSQVSKDHPYIHAIGEVDELNAFIGFVITSIVEKNHIESLQSIQNDLLNLGGELALPGKDLHLLTEDRITYIEGQIKRMNDKLPQLKEFIFPGGSEFSARLHIARTVCRRVERTIVGLSEKENGKDIWIKYLNRLSDYLYVLARYYNSILNKGEQMWNKGNIP